MNYVVHSHADKNNLLELVNLGEKTIPGICIQNYDIALYKESEGLPIAGVGK